MPGWESPLRLPSSPWEAPFHKTPLSIYSPLFRHIGLGPGPLRVPGLPSLLRCQVPELLPKSSTFLPLPFPSLSHLGSAGFSLVDVELSLRALVPPGQGPCFPACNLGRASKENGASQPSGQGQVFRMQAPHGRATGFEL